jgi:TolB-like protein
MVEQSTNGGFLAELKRRNVFRVAVAYLVAAWLLLQVADIVLENIQAPDWIIQVFMLALVVGLPIALIFAWAFEMTPEGLKREKDVDRSRSITHQTGRKLDRAIISILAIAVIVLVIDRFRGPPEQATAPVESTQVADPSQKTAPSIAVLPFVNMSSDPEQEYFSDGISEEILNSLAQVRELKVAGRTSSFAFKGQNQDLRKIGDTLGVAHILEGSVRKSGAKVRITAQLIQVDDGFHLWSETYDRELTDVFAIQDEIANAILKQLKAHLVGSLEMPAVAAAERTDSEVYDLYLLARQRIYERKGPSIEAAADLLDKAIARDPGYAPAYAQRGIAALLLSDDNYGTAPRTESWAQGRLYLDKALQLDPGLAEAWAGLGLYHNNRPGEHTQSIEALEKALAINPNLIDASNWLQIAYSDVGNLRQALVILDRMVERDPLYPPGFSNAINLYNQFGMQEKSWALLERMRPFMPGDPQLLQAEANIWLSLGHPSKALPLLDHAHAAQPNDFVINSLRSLALLQTRQLDRVVDEDGAPWARVIAMSALNRVEEASILAAKLGTEGNVGLLIQVFYQTGQHARLVEFIESRWIDLGAVESEFPDGGDGYGLMLNIAGAYARVENPERFEDAMARVRAAHDRAILQNDKDAGLLRSEARYHALLGKSELAIDYLEQAASLNMLFSMPFHELWPDLEGLRGEPRYEALLTLMNERVEAERKALGLEPVST